ncbi:nudix superfamily hydrolase [Rhodococcus triatomae BKS 15-14]|nr:nudix superfamily hydrolase [Rhodococcus triatomae BKS 15-14]
MVPRLGDLGDPVDDGDRVGKRGEIHRADEHRAVAPPSGQLRQRFGDLGVAQQLGHGHDGPMGTGVSDRDGRREVAAAALVDSGRLLLAQRVSPPELAGRWELPGGKIEPGETPAEGLSRELREELGIEAVVGHRVGVEVPLPNEMVLRAYAVELKSGVPVALEHAAVRWVGVDELADVDLVPNDRAWVPALVELLTRG